MHFTSKKIGDFKTQSHLLSPLNHLCEFYPTNEVRIRSLCNFIIPGIIKNEAIVVIATYENIQMLKNTLILYAIDTNEVIENGQLIFLDAEKTIGQFMFKNHIDEFSFLRRMSTLMDALNSKFSGIRVYGEMVDVLYQMGKMELALDLERLWAEVSLVHPFSLMCGYTAETFKGQNDHIKKICSMHTHLITKGNLEVI